MTLSMPNPSDNDEAGGADTGPRRARARRTRPWEELAVAGDIERAVETFVARNDHVTVVELISRFDAYTKTEGDRIWFLNHTDRGGENLVLWVGIDDGFANLLSQLIDEKRVHVWPCHWFTYLMDGGSLRLPLAKRPPKGGYRKPHWMPIQLRPIPLPNRPLRAHEC